MAGQIHFDYSAAPAGWLPPVEPPDRMLRAVDLHCHSRYAANVSPDMIFENIVPCAWRKGLDVLATGDCLQPDWQHEIATKLVETGSGLLRPSDALEERCASVLPARLRRPLRFLLSTEVSCVPPGTPYMHGHHHLLYFRSLDSVRRFQARIAGFGNFRRGRPALALTSRQLLEHVLAHGEGAALAPAHVFGPLFSTLGGRSVARTLEQEFGELAPQLLAVEVGITSTPAMCRQLSALDRHGLFCCSDAHSLEKLGREYTLLEGSLSYDDILIDLAALQPRAHREFITFPVAASGGYWNGCERCRCTVDGETCPRCGQLALIGSKARVAAIADRSAAAAAAVAPPFREIMPLPALLSRLLDVRSCTREVRRLHLHLLREMGSERHILTTASETEIATLGAPQLARSIGAMRRALPSVKAAA